MVLPSQTMRPINLRKDMYRQRRSRFARIVVVLIGVGAIGFVTYRVWFSGPEGATGKQGSIVPIDPAAVMAGIPAESDQTGRSGATANPGHTTSPAMEMEAVRQPPLASPGLLRSSTAPANQEMPAAKEGSGRDEPTAPFEPLSTAGTGPLTGSTTGGSSAPDESSRQSSREMAGGSQSAKPESAPPAPSPPASAGRSRAAQTMENGLALLNANKPVEGRLRLSEALMSGELSDVDAERTRQALINLNEQLVFGRQTAPDDPFASIYVVQENDRLERIAKEENLTVDWRLLMRVNGIPRPESIRVGQQLKLIHGPFHAIVHKRSFRLDLLLGEGSQRVFVTSFPVGLGERQSTPIGQFKVRPNSKLIDPAWTNPRTNQHFSSQDPGNPIGEHWIGLQGTEAATASLSGYGIHGTIEPDSIGQERSMGCVRMLAADVAVVFETLVEERSTVQIVDD